MKLIPKVAVLAALGIAFATAAAAEVRSSGTWSRQETKIAGSWSIVEEGGELFVKLSDDFKTRSGPDLKIFLSPADLDRLNGKNATSGSVLVARLRSPKGGQSYPLPSGIDLSRYRSIVIHCEKYAKLWGGSSL